MAEKHYKVEVQEDHLERLANARPIQAIAELIWNGLDADAMRVDVEIFSTDMGMQTIVVRDTGHGMPHEEAPILFGKLGGSWKPRKTYTQGRRRILHGKEGKGRFKALALGRVADWNVVYRQDGKLFQYSITLIRDQLIDVRITEPVEVKNEDPGVEVKISELHRDFRSLEEQSAVQELSEYFAIYLTEYPDIVVSYRGLALDPASLIASRKEFKLAPIQADGVTYNVKLELIEWKTPTERAIYLSSENGFPLKRLIPLFHTPGFQFSAYLESSYISKLYESGALDLAEMDLSVSQAYKNAQDKIRKYFEERQVETAKSHIDQWKAEKVYPYAEEPKGSVEEAERKVFDIVALNVNSHLPDFASADPRSKAFQLRMIRQAIERGPEELQLILNEVLGLPPRKQKELAKLLEETTLSNIISASKLVSDRLKFIRGLEAILFDDDINKRLKERSQLHRLLAENSWVFGEEFNLTVDDQSLSEVLHKHLKLEGREIIIDDRPVTKINGSRGIIDLMLTRAVPRNHPDEKEHLVVELKAPKVKIGAKEITQVKQYAFGVAADERFFSLKTNWNFWVLSKELDDYAKQEARQTDRPRGLIHQADNGQTTKIWVKTWAEILEDCRGRLRFVEEKLAVNIDRVSSLKFLHETYAKYLSNLKDIGDEINGTNGNKIEEENEGEAN